MAEFDIFASVLDEIADASETAPASWIDSDAKAEWAIKKIKEETAEYNRMRNDCDEQIRYYSDIAQNAYNRYTKRVENLKAALMPYFDTVEKKQTKTQESYALPSGKLVYTHGKVEPTVTDEAALLDWLEQEHPEYIKRSDKPMWGDFKKTLTIMKNGTISTEDGAVPAGIGLVAKEGKFEIK